MGCSTAPSALWTTRGSAGDFVTKKRDKAAALKFLKNLMKRHRRADDLVTDKPRSYEAALREPGGEDRRVTDGREDNGAENSHQPFRRLEKAMLRFRQMHSLQKFASVHASGHNHLNVERSLSFRTHYKANRAAALAE
jgi:putative transposase